MHDAAQTLTQPRSWRDIPQEVKPRAMSKSGRRRYWMEITKVCAGVALMVSVVWGTVEVVSTFENRPKEVARTAESVPVRELQLGTDGVLTREWLSQTLGLPRGTTLMELDLVKLREKILAHKQVRSAVLTKVFPATLRVDIAERSPVARIRVQVGKDDPRTHFVSRDGIVYLPEHYEDGLMESLPWLEVERLSRAGGHFAPITGMDKVSELLAKARYEAEHLYRGFRVVSLVRYAKDNVIEVNTPEIECVVFSAKDDFFRQLARLDSIRDVLQPQQPLPRLDLSLGREVPVAFASVPASEKANGKEARGAATAVKAAKPQGVETTRASIPQFIFTQRNTSSVREL